MSKLTIFKGGRPETTPSPEPELQRRIRRIIDRLTVLCLFQPAAAKWLLAWLERFLTAQLGG